MAAVLGSVQRMRKKWPEAIESFQNALSFQPTLLRAQLGLIEAYWMSRMPEKADAALAVALQINSKNKEVLAWRAKIHPVN